MSFSFKHVRENHENPGDMFTCWEILSKLVMNLNKGQGVVCKEIVGDEVFLKNILNSTETVARGRVQNLDPNDLVGGTEIGPEWYEVNVKVPIKKDENLVRSYGLFSTIQDCIGVSIAWSYPFISVVHADCGRMMTQDFMLLISLIAFNFFVKC
ncbi:putative transposase, Tnp1/En/Spm [Helianthus debilis subsp. tardiflorus]